MVKRRIALAGIAGLAVMALPIISRSQSHPINHLYVFGDSLSDVGVAYRSSGGTYPPNPPYYQGRFSNGRVWAEYLADDLRLASNQVNSFACGGATTGNEASNMSPGLRTQVQLFLQSRTAVDADGLFTLWAGANDYFQGATSATGPVENIRGAIASLVQAGARRFLIANLPDLGKLPSTRNSGQSAPLDALTQAHNQGLRRMLKLLQQQNSDLQIALLDANTLYRDATSRPSQFGFSQVTTACLANLQICTQPNQYLFWDDIHPTTAAHQILGKAAFQAVQAAGIEYAQAKAA